MFSMAIRWRSGLYCYLDDKDEKKIEVKTEMQPDTASMAFKLNLNLNLLA